MINQNISSTLDLESISDDIQYVADIKGENPLDYFLHKLIHNIIDIATDIKAIHKEISDDLVIEDEKEKMNEESAYNYYKEVQL